MKIERILNYVEKVKPLACKVYSAGPKFLVVDFFVESTMGHAFQDLLEKVSKRSCEVDKISWRRVKFYF